ncbi:Uncharacterised protein [Vibrio cholerae]|nr:Uncharacterised protein [Vibrio cholerae]
MPQDENQTNFESSWRFELKCVVLLEPSSGY